jgi:hypothetical protein
LAAGVLCDIAPARFRHGSHHHDIKDARRKRAPGRQYATTKKVVGVKAAVAPKKADKVPKANGAAKLDEAAKVDKAAKLDEAKVDKAAVRVAVAANHKFSVCYPRYSLRFL